MDDVRLKNQTSRPHNFMMMVTSPFVAPDKLHGICGANDMVTFSELSNDDIVRQHDSKLPLEGFIVVRGKSIVFHQEHHSHCTSMGADNFSKAAICKLKLLATHLVEVEPDVKQLTFTKVDVDMTSSISIEIVNCSSLTVPCMVVVSGGSDTSVEDETFHVDPIDSLQP